MFQNAEQILLVGSILLFLSIFMSKAGFRFGIPALLLFLGVGMLAGIDGIGIHFASPQLAQFIGVVALSIILFSGGMDTRVKDVRPIMWQGIMLSTVGVLINTFVTGAFIFWLTGLVTQYETFSFAESLLLSAVMSSTDSASVFSILRSKNIHLKHNLRPTLELESGSNDPMAYMLTIILISYIQSESMSFYEALLMVLTQLVVGFAGGYLLGKGSVRLINRIRIENKSLYPIMVLATIFFIFSITTMCKGNGYLAVYIAGLIFGNAKLDQKRSIETFFDGFAWLWQIVMFITLGLLVNPHELPPVAGIGLLVGVFMILIARPVSVFISLLPFKNVTLKSKFFLSWVGLRGAVPIIFATYPLIAGIENAGLIFNVVFFITIMSLLVQGTTLMTVAQKLNLVDKPKYETMFEFELPQEIKSSMTEVKLTPEAVLHGATLKEFALPDWSVVMMIKRDGNFFVPKGNTQLMVDDILLVISDNDEALHKTYKKMGIKGYSVKKH